ncbi:MAG TPA: hypothetical protein VL126_13010 [Bacteroidota bacterium]|nr:hypothetical protein [Bacteroidota bacterium]
MRKELGCICILLILIPSVLSAQGHRGGRGRRSDSAARWEETGGGRRARLEPPLAVPITRPVDVIWPPVIVAPPTYVPPAYPTEEASTAPPGRRIVQVQLDDCVENGRMAGYSFADQRIVSCEDSSVDVYLSYTDDGNYYFLVPEDTDIKDIGQRNALQARIMIKPGNWSTSHSVQLMAGHEYVLWTPEGDLFLIRVSALWNKHVLFDWVWHSNLSRKDAEEFLKKYPNGPPQTPYFNR